MDIVETPQVEGTTPSPECKTCAAHQESQAQSEETGMAFLLALTPVMTLSLFGVMGLL